jgi:hypothetical protein
MSDFEITVWFTEAGISEKGQKLLLSAEVRDEAAIELLDLETLLTIKLAPGDLVKFKKAQALYIQEQDKVPGLVSQNPSVKEAEAAAAAAAASAASSASTASGTKGLYTLDQFADFLAGKSTVLSSLEKSSAAGKLFGGAELPSPSSEGNLPYTPEAGAGSGDAISLGKSLMKDILCMDDACNEKGEKPLLPVNFVSTPCGIILNQEKIVTTNKDGELVIKPSKNRPTGR